MGELNDSMENLIFLLTATVVCFLSLYDAGY